MNNAQLVDKIRALCKEKNTSLPKLEAQLHFANGYIGKMPSRKAAPTYDRLVAIAQALGVTVEELTGENEKPSTIEDGSLSKEDAELMELILKASPEKKEAIRMLLR